MATIRLAAPRRYPAYSITSDNEVLAAKLDGADYYHVELLDWYADEELLIGAQCECCGSPDSGWRYSASLRSLECMNGACGAVVPVVVKPEYEVIF